MGDVVPFKVRSHLTKVGVPLWRLERFEASWKDDIAGDADRDEIRWLSENAVGEWSLEVRKSSYGQAELGESLSPILDIVLYSVDISFSDPSDKRRYDAWLDSRAQEGTPIPDRACKRCGSVMHSVVRNKVIRCAQLAAIVPQRSCYCPECGHDTLDVDDMKYPGMVFRVMRRNTGLPERGTDGFDDSVMAEYRRRHNSLPELTFTVEEGLLEREVEARLRDAMRLAGVEFDALMS